MKKHLELPYEKPFTAITALSHRVFIVKVTGPETNISVARLKVEFFETLFNLEPKHQSETAIELRIKTYTDPKLKKVSSLRGE